MELIKRAMNKDSTLPPYVFVSLIPDEENNNYS